MTTQGNAGYRNRFIVVDSQRELNICFTPPRGIVSPGDFGKDFLLIEPLDVTFSCSPLLEQTVRQRSGQVDSQATVDSTTFLQEHKTRDCTQKTHQLAGQQKSANGGMLQHLPLEESEGVKGQCYAPAAATTLDSELQREGFAQLLW